MARVALRQMPAAVLLLTAALAHAQVPRAGEGPEDPNASLGVKRRYLQASFNKIRPGSLLRGEGDKTGGPAKKNSAFEQRRDSELRGHYSRMAELDVMVEVAGRAHNVGLAERIDLTRRREVSRFLLAMQRLQVDILANNQEFGP